MQMRLGVDLVLFFNWGGLKTFGVQLRGLLVPLFYVEGFLGRRHPGAKLASNGSHEKIWVISCNIFVSGRLS
jgi:hypothetical protein